MLQRSTQSEILQKKLQKTLTRWRDMVSARGIKALRRRGITLVQESRDSINLASCIDYPQLSLGLVQACETSMFSYSDEILYDSRVLLLG